MSAARNDVSGTAPARRTLSVASADRPHDQLPALPCAIEAEQAVLGALMIQPDALARVKDWLSEGDFFRHDHRAIYRAICTLSERKLPVDSVTLGEWFDANGLADLIGGMGYLCEVEANTASAANIVAHAEIVVEKARLRAAIDIGENLRAAAMQGGDDLQALLAQAHADLLQISARSAKRDPITSALSSAMAPFSSQELDDAQDSHPHAFAAGETGLFPIGEVSVVAAQGREGKTYSLVAIAAAYVRGKRLGGLAPSPDRLAIIYSAEDDRRQYARKVAALRWVHGDAGGADSWCGRIVVPDLGEGGLSEWRELVRVVDRRPAKAPAVNALISALKPRMADPMPPGLLIFETASTLSEADEDNAGLKTLVGALKQIARELDVAVVLVHHTSQAASNNLATLSIGINDVRGATALVYNARQCFLLVNLGSDDDPFAENDARTILRKIAAPHETARVSALICLDSSKARDPAPIFMRWRGTPDFGPALEELTPPSEIAGQRWRKVLATLNGWRAEARADAKATEAAAKVREVVEAVRKLQAEDKPASAKAVSLACGRSKEWATPYLERAVEQQALITSAARIPHTKGETTIYQLSDWAGVAQQ